MIPFCLDELDKATTLSRREVWLGVTKRIFDSNEKKNEDWEQYTKHQADWNVQHLSIRLRSIYIVHITSFIGVWASFAESLQYLISCQIELESIIRSLSS